MHRNKKIICLSIVIVLLIGLIVNLYSSNTKDIYKNNKINTNNNKMLTMMFESTAESGVYEVDDEETSFDQSSYYFNPVLSGCEHGGTVSYENDTVTMQSSYTDKCFVYFSTSDVSDGSGNGSNEENEHAFLYGFNIMLQTEMNGEEYILSSLEDKNNGKYVFNASRSYCDNGGSISHSINTFTISGQSNNITCYLYYDNQPTIASYIINLYNAQATEGANGIYKHDLQGTYASYEAGDNSYRYSGPNSQIANNYVCFGSNASSCPDDYLYRIIGVFNGQLKIIKASWLLTSQVGTTYAQNASSYNNHFYWSGGAQSSDWCSSTFNNDALNTVLFNIFNNVSITNSDKTFGDLIATHNYKPVGSSSSTPKQLINSENASSNVCSRRIGIMNMSDYAYGTSPAYWNQSPLYGRTNNWLFNGNAGNGKGEWLLAPASSNTAYQIIYDNGGFTTAYVSGGNGVRPVFYLKENVLLDGEHNGSSSDPYRLSL